MNLCKFLHFCVIYDLMAVAVNGILLLESIFLSNICNWSILMTC